MFLGNFYCVRTQLVDRVCVCYYKVYAKSGKMSNFFNCGCVKFLENAAFLEPFDFSVGNLG